MKNAAGQQKFSERAARNESAKRSTFRIMHHMAYAWCVEA